MALRVNNLGLATKHAASFCHKLPNGFPYWMFLHTLTPVLANFESSSLHPVEPGTCFIYPPGHARYLFAAPGEKNLVNDWIHFEADNDDYVRARLDSLNIPISRPFMLRQFTGISETIKSIIFEHNTSQPLSAEMNNLLIEQLLVYIGRNILKNSEKQDTHLQAHIQAFELLRRSIYTSPELDWSMQTMSEKVFLSANQLITIYRRLFNTTPKQDLLNARVQKAKTLLQTTLTLREVAALSGFQNEYYFSTAFRKKTGMTPSVFSKATRAQALIPETQEDE